MKSFGEPAVVTVNCPDEIGIGCDICCVILEFGLCIIHQHTKATPLPRSPSRGGALHQCLRLPPPSATTLWIVMDAHDALCDEYVMKAVDMVMVCAGYGVEVD